MFKRLLARLRPAPTDYTPRHSATVPSAAPGEPVGAAVADLVASPPASSSRPPPPPAVASGQAPAYPVGGARVSFLRSDGTSAPAEVDPETASRMDYVVRRLIENDPVRRTT